jgi:hypothetical protein
MLFTDRNGGGNHVAGDRKRGLSVRHGAGNRHSSAQCPGRLTAQDAPFEKIRSAVTSCAKSAETMTLTQYIIAPFVVILYLRGGTNNVHDQLASSSRIVFPQANIPFMFA